MAERLVQRKQRTRLVLSSGLSVTQVILSTEVLTLDVEGMEHGTTAYQLAVSCSDSKIILNLE